MFVSAALQSSGCPSCPSRRSPRSASHSTRRMRSPSLVPPHPAQHTTQRTCERCRNIRGASGRGAARQGGLKSAIVTQTSVSSSSQIADLLTVPSAICPSETSSSFSSRYSFSAPRSILALKTIENVRKFAAAAAERTHSGQGPQSVCAAHHTMWEREPFRLVGWDGCSHGLSWAFMGFRVVADRRACPSRSLASST